MKQVNKIISKRHDDPADTAQAPVVEEALFRRMLSLERRRCERTEIPFALVLLELEELGGAVSETALKQLTAALASAMRETDITGWYEQLHTIGIILTTLNGTDRATLESIIIARIGGILPLHLTAAQIGQIRISCHVFPEDNNGGVSRRKLAGVFYGEPEKKDFKSKNPARIKKAIDVAGSLAALIGLSPVFVVIAILVKMTSAGPVFFRQKRIGRFGEEFTFLKFRSMYVDNDSAIHKDYIRDLIGKKVSDSDGTFKIKNDPRVTSVGKFLRKSSLDELPQFVNVLRGEMSLVGPRPPIRYEFEHYSLWHRRRILMVKPGITGEWQVNGRSRTTFDEMVRMDLRYIDNQSIWLDLKILLKTPFAVLTGHGAF